MDECFKCGEELPHKRVCIIETLELMEDSKILEIEKGKEQWIEFIPPGGKKKVLIRKVKKWKYGKSTSFTLFWDKKKKYKGKIEYYYKGDLIAIVNKEMCEVETWSR